MIFVLDNSVVCGWLIAEQATQYSEAIKTLLQRRRAVAPALLPMEYTNVLRTACKRGKLTAQRAQVLIAALAQLPVDIDTVCTPAAELFSLALRYDLSSYDAQYLALALRLQCPIATQDATLAAAAVVSGVGVVGATDC